MIIIWPWKNLPLPIDRVANVVGIVFNATLTANQAITSVVLRITGSGKKLKEGSGTPHECGSHEMKECSPAI